jgi:hypothetical protein
MSKAKNETISVAPSELLRIYWLVTGQLWKLGIGEDPHQGQRPIDQITLKATIHDLANGIADPTVRNQVQTALANGLASIVQKMVKETSKKAGK